MKTKIIKILIILWIAFIFFNSLQPANVSSAVSGGITSFIYNAFVKIGIDFDIVKLSHYIRKLAHISEFFILSLLLVLHERSSYNSLKRQFLIVIMFSLLIAIIDEIIQTFVPGRAGLVSDVLIDMIGASIGSLTLLVKRKKIV